MDAEHPTFECPRCHAEFESPERLEDHGLRVHAGDSDATR